MDILSDPHRKVQVGRGCLYINYNITVPHKGFEPTPCYDIWLATFHILEMLYDTPFPDCPQTERIEKPDRNAEILARYEAGETGAILAEDYGISEQRVSQIVRGKRK